MPSDCYIRVLILLETVTEIAARLGPSYYYIRVHILLIMCLHTAIYLGVDSHEILRLNKGRYTGLTLNSRLFAGTLLLLPQDEEVDGGEGGPQDRRRGVKQVVRRSKGLIEP